MIGQNQLKLLAIGASQDKENVILSSQCLILGFFSCVFIAYLAKTYHRFKKIKRNTFKHNLEQIGQCLSHQRGDMILLQAQSIRA